MARASFILSGSRALEVFVPGSCCDLSSDWDFYIPFSAYCVGIALQTLSTCGVVWNDIFEPVRAIARAPGGTVLEMHVDVIKGLVTYAQRFPGDIQLDDESLATLQAMRKCMRNRYCRQMQFGNVVVKVLRGRHSVPYYSPTSIYIITGHTTHNDTNQKVQLIFKPATSPIEHIMAFYASSVQCLVSAFGAAHFYSSLANGRQAFYWPNNSQHHPSAAAAMCKYSNRGWSFTVPSHLLSTSIQRAQLSGSSDSKVVLFDIDTGLSPTLAEARQNAFKSLAWECSEGETRFVPSAPKSGRKIFAANRKRRCVFHYQRPVLNAAKMLAVQHSLAFKRNGRWAYPDEIVGF